MKKFERTHRGVDIWYDEGHNLWRSQSGLQSKSMEDLEALIDRDLDKAAPIPCIMVEIRPSLAEYCEVVKKFDNGSLRIKTAEGNLVTMPPDNFYKDTTGNRDILNIFVENGEKMRKLMEGLERL